MTETRLLIRGEQVTGDGERLDVENPYTQETIASVELPSDEQVDAAIAAAREAARGLGPHAGRRARPSSCTRSPRGCATAPTSSRG